MFPLVPVEPSAHLGRHVGEVEGFVTHCLIPAQVHSVPVHIIPKEWDKSALNKNFLYI
jgi:hypothetical protein